MSERAHISIVIPAWNNWALTRDCLGALAAHSSGAPFEVILADNGSTDETPRDCQLLGAGLFGERFRCERLPQNRGFAAACNLGARAATGKFLFFLNNDALVSPGWLEPLLEALRADQKLAGVGPVLTFPEDDGPRSGRVQHLGIAASLGPEFRHLYELFPASHSVVLRRRRLQVITAAAMLVPAALFHGLGGFFEGFANGMEDVDFCCRAAKKGGRFSVVPESRAVHLTNRTAGRFSQERENLKLLLARRPAPQEDLARLVEEDGYALAFTPWLDLAVVPGTDRAREAEASWAADPDPQRLPGLLAREPLWDEGYVLWGRHAPDHAVMAASLRASLLPGLPACLDYARVLGRAGQEALAAKTLAMARSIQEVLADPAALVRKAEALRRKSRDPACHAALDAWLKARRPSADASGCSCNALH